MEGVCVGCEKTKFVVDYLYIPNHEATDNRGQYCIDCMCCFKCGEVLPPNRLGYMESIYIPKRGKKGGNKMRMNIPAQWCAICIPEVLELEPMEEWDVQPQ